MSGGMSSRKPSKEADLPLVSRDGNMTTTERLCCIASELGQELGEEPLVIRQKNQALALEYFDRKQGGHFKSRIESPVPREGNMTTVERLYCIVSEIGYEFVK